MRPIHTVVIHCTASDNPAHDNLETIRSWHLARGWHDIGYHFLILKNGMIEDGRPLEEVGAHVQGHNVGSVGIALSGEKLFTCAQAKSVVQCIEYLEALLGHKLDVKPHNAFTSAKTCPNLDVPALLRGEIRLTV